MLKIAFLSGLLFLLALACLAGFLWTIYCYNATYRCRLHILECVREGNRARFADGDMTGILYEAFLAVPHEAH